MARSAPLGDGRPAPGTASDGRAGLGHTSLVTRPRGECEPVGLEDAIRARSLVSGTAPPLNSVTRFLEARLASELRVMAAVKSADSDTLNVPGLAVVVEQVGHLLDMAAADEVAEEAKNQKRAATAESNNDRCVKIGKVECGGFKDNLYQMV
nr:unnamed protein product [Digitaria exilis]